MTAYTLAAPLLFSRDNPQGPTFNAVTNAHGLYNTFQFALRLSPEVHRLLGEVKPGVTTSGQTGFDHAQAFSTLLHETVHWWQHIGSTYGLMLNLTYPVQLHGNYNQLRELVTKVGFKKDIRTLASTMPGPKGYGTVVGLANIIINNHFDFGAFRGLTLSRATLKQTGDDPMFECVGHAREPAERLAVALYVVALATPANARCVCRCINGQVQDVCDSAIDIPPICTPQICPITPPSIAPIPKPTIPPLGTTSCRQVQVLNPRTNQYEWRQVCQ